MIRIRAAEVGGGRHCEGCATVDERIHNSECGFIDAINMLLLPYRIPKDSEPSYFRLSLS